MKIHTTIATSILALGLVSGLSSQTPAATPAADAPAAPAAPAAPQFSEAEVLETYGWYLGKNSGLAELEFSKEQVDALARGMQIAREGKDAPHAIEKIGPQIDVFLRARQEKYMAGVKAKAAAETEAFMAGLKAKPGLVTLPSGLSYEIVQPGTGEFPKVTDTVKIHYTGKLTNGTTFDTSVGGEPAELPLNGVVPGFSEGLQKINKGGKIKLYIPPQLGYGDRPAGSIPPGSTLVFDVELIEIKAPAAAPAAAPAPEVVAPAAK